MSARKSYVRFEFIWLQFLLLGFFRSTESLVCYQCSDSASGEDCQINYEGMEKEFTLLKIPSNSSQAVIEPFLEYTQKCSQNFCILQKITQSGDTVGFIRGCSSGKDTLPRASYITKEEDIKPDNKTTCGISESGTMIVCVTFCQTDFCNGPQFRAPVSSGNIHSHELSALWKTVLLFVIACLLSRRHFP
ncbi:uncharacterized protein [Argopecten irradians]|uniref:uncharacterized protein n=1 Tax=Argopecten irradians TaxID=31199 RepID=UPI00371076F9